MIRLMLKKILIGGVIAMSMSLSAVLAAGTCQMPANDVSSKAFCECFLEESEMVCLRDGRQHGISKEMCSQYFILNNIKHITKPSLFCRKYWFMLPEGVDTTECIDDMIYVKKHC